MADENRRPDYVYLVDENGKSGRLDVRYCNHPKLVKLKAGPDPLLYRCSECLLPVLLERRLFE